MIKVGICTYPLKSGHRTRGVGFYTKNLLESLKKISNINIIEFDDLTKLSDVDLIHYPYFDLFFNSLPIKKKFPTVVTIHDVTPLVFPQHYPLGLKGRLKYFLQRLSLLNVKAIITDSESSKHDIRKYLKLKPSKIFPIHLSPDKIYQPINNYQELEKIALKYNLPEKFALFVGSVNWNKNLINVTQSCLDLGVDLVLVGKDFESKDNLGHVEKKSYKEFLEKYSNSPKVHVLGFVPDNELVAIFNLADVLLYCSFYEGFGLPILEAQMCKTPVITSNISSMPEVAGQGAYLVDPNDNNSISGAITKVINDQKLRTELIKTGLENVKRFSWEKTANKTILAYQEVLKK